MEEKPVFSGLGVYRSQGAYLRRLEQHEKALAAYDQASRFCPEDVQLLTDRSQLYADMLRPQEANYDAELALKLEPKNLTAKNMQARAQYVNMEFEKSVVTSYRGLKSRKRPSYFKVGIEQGVQTIQDCIGENTGDVMRNFLPLINCNQPVMLTTDEYEPEKPKRVSRIPKMEKVKKLTQTELRQKENLSRVLANKYLGPMAYDKLFLQIIKKDPRLVSANSKGNGELNKFIEEALSSLIGRQDMLRAQRPYYTIKLAEKAESKNLNKHKQSLLIKERQINIRTAESYLREIEKCLHANLLKELLKKAERMQVFLDNKTPRTMPSKEMYIDRLYKAVGEGYLSTYRLSGDLSERGNRWRVAFLMGMKVGRPSSFDSVMATYPYKVDDVKRATDKVAYSLEMCENFTMKCFLHCELSRLLCQQENYVHAKYYAKCCQRDAIELNNKVWWMNGLFTMLSGDMQQGNANDVCNEVDEGLKWAKLLPQFQRIPEFLLKCKEMVLETPVTDDRHMTAKREKEILNIMDDKSRNNTEVLFKRMSVVPSQRHFSVLPGKQEARRRQMETARRRYRQRGLSVVPGPEKPLRHPPVSKVPGFQIFQC